MAKKVQKCSFCNRQSIGSAISKWGAWCEETGNYICLDCVVMIYNGILDQVKQQDMTDSIEERKRRFNSCLGSVETTLTTKEV